MNSEKEAFEKVAENDRGSLKGSSEVAIQFARVRSPLFLDTTQAATRHPLDCIKQQMTIRLGHAAE